MRPRTSPWWGAPRASTWCVRRPARPGCRPSSAASGRTNFWPFPGTSLTGMVPTPNLLAFAVASALLIMIPGPSVLFVLGRSISLGRRGGLLSVLGNALGMLPAIAAVALGVGALVAQSVVVFTVVKVVGAAYLVFLGIQAIRHRKERAQPDQSTAPRSTFRLLAEGFVVGITNPKTIAFFVAVLPQFVDHAAGAI